jgi:hypothetical protein
MFRGYRGAKSLGRFALSCFDLCVSDAACQGHEAPFLPARRLVGGRASRPTGARRAGRPPPGKRRPSRSGLNIKWRNTLAVEQLHLPREPGIFPGQFFGHPLWRRAFQGFAVFGWYQLVFGMRGLWGDRTNRAAEGAQMGIVFRVLSAIATAWLMRPVGDGQRQDGPEHSELGG